MLKVKGENKHVQTIIYAHPHFKQSLTPKQDYYSQLSSSFKRIKTRVSLALSRLSTRLRLMSDNVAHTDLAVLGFHQRFYEALNRG